MPRPSNIPGRDLKDGLLDSPLIMSFGDHLEDLRKRVFLAVIGILPIFFVAFIFFGSPILKLLIKPALEKLHEGGQPPVLQATSPFETFGTVVQIALVVTILVGAPWILYQLWRFVSPGLYAHEKRIAYLLIPFSGILTVLSMLFLYFAILPVILAFFIGFNASVSGERAVPGIALPQGVVLPTIPVLQGDPIDPPVGSVWINEPLMQQRVYVGLKDGKPLIQVAQLTTQTGILQQYRISEYIKTLLNMGLAFGIAFQTPVVIVMLGWVGLLDPKAMGKWRRHAIVICAILGAILTPADPVSMILLAVPLYALYELGLFVLRVMPIERVIGSTKLDQDPNAITPTDDSDG
ncbi:MAG: twin-arginine translocase subunit TatC [Phycisphaerales bacterium]|nr:twin-arginine translocase subunit TatC [Phycisphaerales bacterium]